MTDEDLVRLIAADRRLWWRVEPTTGRWYRWMWSYGGWMWSYGEGMLQIGSGGVTHSQKTAVRKAQRGVERLRTEYARNAALGEGLRWDEGDQ